MAGATAEVLLPQPISEIQRAALCSYIQSVACEVDGTSFWIAGRPFSWYDEPADNEVKTKVIQGWRPQAQIGFCAMCRGLASEAFLAMLVARVAQMFGGVIAFGDHIAGFTDDSFILHTDGRQEDADEDYLTPEFLHCWIGHPKFRMCN